MQSSVLHTPVPPTVTVIEVVYPPNRGRIGLRGSRAPFSWEHTEAPSEVRGNVHVFEVSIPPDEIVEIKVVRNDEEWADGPNYAIHAGDHLRIEPHFDARGPSIQAGVSVEGAELGPVTIDVLLPANYDEQEEKRYPVIYALDGQSLWSTSSDPFGVWHLDTTLQHLHELGAVEDVIVVGIHTALGRIEALSPVADPSHGGGNGSKLLDAIAGPVKAHVDRTWRTLTSPEDTAILGSSMGGLFAFYAAWSRPDVFGRAACLSSSFWWADRWAVRWLQEHVPRENDVRPFLYLDSGATLNPHERDVNVRDGFHHTRSMFRALVGRGYVSSVDLHRLVFPGHTHDAASWAARISIPLQLLFPARGRSPSPETIARAL